MKCIDAIEGTVKSILNSVHSYSIDNCLDDSEYVCNAKAIIEGTGRFIAKNPEVVDDPQLLLNVLYMYSRNLWLASQQPAGQGQQVKLEDIASDNEEYQTYYYDYLYQRGIYPL